MAAAASEPGNVRNAIGYLGRRPCWTRESWRRYLLSCAIPVGALLLFLAMMTVVELQLPIAGAPRSIPRVIWIGVMVSSMLVGAVGLGLAVHRLAGGDPARQFGESRLRR